MRDKTDNSIPTINMRSTATIIKGQGVGSCYKEQVRLIQSRLQGYETKINSLKTSDIYHYHTINPTYYIEILFVKRRTSSVGYVHFVPDTLEDSLSMPNFMKKLLYKYLLAFYNSMDYLVTVNPNVITKLKAYNINHPQILYIPNFVSPNDFYIQNTAEIKQTREKFNLPQDKTIVLSVGQLQTRKGVLDFIQPAEQMPQVQFVWAGGFCFGKMSSGYSDIQNSMKNLPANVTFLGMVDRCNMCSL